ncbi:MAG: DNA-3-methyladenine glycosylase I [Peptoniphilaceae bacterium]|nr:DNA-3-methyladenine glycosylase I [Peptoniphilaceae bacterium]MDY6018602.1 DNA-3-methyladenine glycosylase I [Anaerococcus sp.]
MDDIIKRCDWAKKDLLLQEYHDKFWGKPVYDDRILFKMLVLETMQAGLSWLTVLKKIDNFDRAFDGFDPLIICNYDDKKEQELMEDKGIIRNRLKIKSVKANAIAFLKIVEEFGSFSKYLWAFVDNKVIENKREKSSDIPVRTELSDKISADMKKRGFKFVGSITIYSYLEAVGLVNDHLLSCDFRNLDKNTLFAPKKHL